MAHERAAGGRPPATASAAVTSRRSIRDQYRCRRVVGGQGLAVPARRLPILLLLFLCAGAANLLLHAPAGPALASGLILQGIAQASMMTIVILLLVETRGVASRGIGMAGGLFFSAAEIGGVLGPLGIGILSDATGGFSAALFLLTGVCAALVLLLARLWRLER